MPEKFHILVVPRDTGIPDSAFQRGSEFGDVPDGTMILRPMTHPKGVHVLGVSDGAMKFEAFCSDCTKDLEVTVNGLGMMTDTSGEELVVRLEVRPCAECSGDVERIRSELTLEGE